MSEVETVAEPEARVAEPGDRVAEPGDRVAHHDDRAPQTDPTSGEAPSRRRPARWWRQRWVRWLVVVAIVLLLVGSAVGTLSATLGAQQADDPASVTGSGAAAVAQLLRDQGVELTRTDDIDAVGADTGTVVVVHPERLNPTRLRQLIGSGSGPVVLIRPDQDTLAGLGLNAPPDAVGSVSDSLLQPSCDDPTAQRAGTIDPPDLSLAYTLPGTTGCYRTSDGGLAVVQVEVDGRPVVLWGAPPRNSTLTQQGNAAYALGLLGSRPQLTWLMAPRQPATTTTAPQLLPDWWPAAVTQAVLGLVVLGVWRGRRFGPIIAERLPVVVRAGETLEGHGRLYHRLSARHRAAEALRDGVRRRLGPRYGQPGAGRGDPAALAAAVAARIGRDPHQVQAWLNGPAPIDDDHLVQLAHDLDRLEQEAQQL